MSNIDLTIRAGAVSDPEPRAAGAARSYRPVMVFSPEDSALEGVSSKRSMISVSGGRLTLLNVAVELDLPLFPFSDGGWALFQLRRCDVSLTKCVLTVSDQGAGFEEQAGFFSVKDSSGGMVMMSENMPPRKLEPARIVLTDCAARGEADFLQTADSQPTTLTWNNGLLTCTGYLLRTTGGQPASMGARLEITLDHVTANVSRSGLCLIKRREDFPHLLFTDLKCRNSILRGSPDTPLVEHVGLENTDSISNLFAWSGTRNHYEGFQTFWRINELYAQQEPLTLNFREWNSKWESQENQSGPPRAAGWKTPLDRNLAAHAQTPGNFALSESSPARGAAGDQGDIGMRTADLPTAPPEFLAPAPPLASPQ